MRSDQKPPRPATPNRRLGPIAAMIAQAVALTSLIPCVAAAQPSVDETVERIGELRREIEELLDALPPAQRAEVERRLAEAERERSLARVRVDAEPEPPPRVAPAELVPPEVARPAPSRPGCRALAVLDSNADGQVTGADRYWRHLYLELQGEDEPVSLFDLDIRGVTVELDAYTTEQDFVGDIAFDDEAVFRLVGRRRGPDRGSLAIDADGLRRGEGPSLVDAEGQPLRGIQRIRAGQALVDGNGARHPIACQPPPPP